MPRTKPPFRADHVGACCVRPPQGGARQRERGEITARARDDRRPRDRDASSASRRRSGSSRSPTASSAARSGNYDFLGELDGVEAYRRRAQDQVPGRRSRKPMMLRVIGKLGGFSGHPMIEHFKFVAGAYQGDAEDDDPVAVVAAFPLRPRRGAGRRSIPTMDDFYRDLGADLPQGGARLRRRRLPLSAARRGQLHLSLRSEAARAGRATAATIRSSCRTSMPA